MTPDKRWVIDTNLLVSRLLLPDSVSSRAVQLAVETGDLLVSDATLRELAGVLARPKFDRYLSAGDRTRFFELLAGVAVRIEVIQAVTVCRDPRDDMFLDVAVNGEADALLTGDNDLLILNPFRGIPVISPREFLDQAPAEGR